MSETFTTVKDGEVEVELPSNFAPQATGDRLFKVTWPKQGGEVAQVRARDANEAWAVFCDSKKVWPSPKSAKVEEVAASGGGGGKGGRKPRAEAESTPRPVAPASQTFAAAAGATVPVTPAGTAK